MRALALSVSWLLSVALAGAQAPEDGSHTAEDSSSNTPRPAVGMNGVLVDGLITQSEAIRIFLSGHPALVGCYEEAIQQEPGIAGDIHVRLVIRANGRIDAANASTNISGARPLVRCFERIVKNWRFPSRGGASTLTYVLRLGREANFGFGGLGLRGSGRGGGGTTEGTIGLGNLRTIGARDGSRPVATDGRPPRVPNVRAGTTLVRGSLSREVIRRVVRHHIAEVRSCYERTLAQEPGLQGRVEVRFIISPTGHIQHISSVDVDEPLQVVANCIMDRVREWRFPPPDGGGVVVVNYPFALSPG